jgi:peroxiredoxin
VKNLIVMASSGLALAAIVGCPSSAAPPRTVDVEAIDAGSAGSNASTTRDSVTPGSTPVATAKPPMSSGPKAPPISLDSLTTPGKVTVPEGKVVIVDFWATWCEPCKKSFPKLQELYVKYKASGLEIAAISVDDDKNGVAAFAKTYGAKFPIAWDKDHKVANLYKPESMPTTLVIDKHGTIVHVHKGYHEGEIDEIEREIKALF